MPLELANPLRQQVIMTARWIAISERDAKQYAPFGA